MSTKRKWSGACAREHQWAPRAAEPLSGYDARSLDARLFQEPSAIRVRPLTIDPAIFSLAAWNFVHECARTLLRLLCKPPAEIAEEGVDPARVAHDQSSLRLALEFRRLSCSSNSFTASLYSVSGSSCRGAFSSFSSMRICWEMIVSAVSLT